jgi:chromosome segregation ATPase
LAKIVYTDLSGEEKSVQLGPEYPVVTIGRATDCTIRSNRKSVSRRHAEFRYAAGQFEIIDLNSSNGTYLSVNGDRKQIGREQLSHEEDVWCGDFLVHFLREDDTRAAPYQQAAPVVTNNYEEPRYDEKEFGGNYPAQGAYEPHLPESDGEWRRDDPVIQQTGPTNPDYQRNDEELDRLLAEKKSIEDLAARQALEIEELRSRQEEYRQEAERLRTELTSSNESVRDDLGTLRDEIDTGREERRRLEERLHGALQKADRYDVTSEELGRKVAVIQELEAELTKSQIRIEEQSSQIDKDRGIQAQFETQVNDLATAREHLGSAQSEIEAGKNEAQRLRQEIASTIELQAERDSAKADAEALKIEVDRHKRLVDEFERRNRDIQLELDQGLKRVEQVESDCGTLREAAATFENELESVRRNAKKADDERDAAVQGLAALQANNREGELADELETLRAEIESQREAIQNSQAELQSNDTDKDVEIEALQAQIVEIEANRAALEESSNSSGPSIDAVAARKHLQALSRVVLAVERLMELHRRLDIGEITDEEAEHQEYLHRVRLKAAFKETDPTKTFGALLDMLPE